MLNWKTLRLLINGRFPKMLKCKYFKCTLFVGLIISVCFVTNASTQEISDKKRQAFQNQQRALSLSFYKNNIQNLENAPMRCYVRKQIIEFVFKEKVKEHFEMAEDFATDCFEDIKNNPNEFLRVGTYIFSGELMSLLRINSPDAAKQIEQKYELSKEVSEYTDFLDANLLDDPDTVINRILLRVKTGQMSRNIIYLLPRISERNPVKVIPLLDEILKYYEKLPITKEFDSDLTLIGNEYLKKSIPVRIKRRYLSLVIRLGQRAIVETSDSQLFNTATDLLKSALPIVKGEFPNSYSQAAAILATLESKYSQIHKEELEINKRIKESKNKLEQTIFEAKSTENEAIKSALWWRASKLALKEKKFRLSVDCVLNNKSSNDEFTKSFITLSLIKVILPVALKENDFESADYIIENTDQLIAKAFGSLSVSSEYLKLKEESLPLEKLNDAIRILDKADDDIHKVRAIFEASILATKIKNADAFEIANFAIRTINKLPGLDAEHLIGSNDSNKYVAYVLIPNAYNIESAFESLSQKRCGFCISDFSGNSAERFATCSGGCRRNE